MGKRLLFGKNVQEIEVGKNQDYKEEISCLKKKIDSGYKAFKEIENRNTFLEMETRTLDKYKNEIDEMKKTIAILHNDKKVTELESELIKEKEKNLSLTKQLQESQNMVTEHQELKELRTKFWRIERELGNAKIDKRILERELKDAQSETKQANEKLRDIEENSKKVKGVHEAALLELSNINESLTMDLIKVKDECRIIDETLKKERLKFDGEKSVVSELKEIIRSKDDQINSLHSDINLIKKERNNLENQIKILESCKHELMSLMESLQKEKGDILNESVKVRRELQNTNLNLTALREACSLLENQVIEYEKLVASFKSKEKDLHLNTEKLIKDVCDAKRELQEAKKLANEEKSLKLFAETKIKKLKEEIDCLQNECISYRQQSSEYRQFSTGLSSELSAAEEKIGSLEITVKTYERQIEEMRSEARVLKQETSDYLTQLNRSKELTYKLKHQLSEHKEENEAVKQHLHETQRILTEKSSYYKEREMKYDATIKQQIKLIDYLQSKIDEQNHKKKTLTEVIFGSSKKENQPPLSLTMNYKDLESQLLKERQHNQQLNEEIYKLKAATMVHDSNKLADKMKAERSKSDVLSPKSKAALQQLVNSPSKQQREFNRQNSQRRMHHNIPHRFESKFSRSSTKCSGCSEQISLGRTAAVCSECTIHVHMECKSHVPNTCGLPAVYAKHYKESLPSNEDKVEVNDTKEGINIEGWIKVPGRTNTWEKRYAILTDQHIKIFSTSPKEKSAVLLETFELKPSNTHGKVISEPLPTEIGIPVANSDILFVLKVEVTPDTTCWPPKSLVFLTLSAPDKDKWFLALQKIYYDDLDRPKCDRILVMPEDVEVSCVVELTENIMVLGTTSGLYSYYDNHLLYIAGLKSIHQISVMSTTNKVLMTVEDNRRLICCDLNHLINLTQCSSQSTKPKLKFEEIDVLNLSGFHILQVSYFSKQPKICVANERHLVILELDTDTSEFVPIKRLDTAEPTGCALFTESSLIVGADKFFEIDLDTFQAEEFLDASDARLKQAESCYKLGSFPLAIVEVGKNPKEYLLCFNEFSVFVDEYGRSTRQNELKSTHLPLAFHFSKSYLYISQFAAVGILKLSEETCNNDEKPEIFRVELDKFKYLGSNKQGIYISVNNEVRFISGSKLIPSDDSSSEIDNSDNNSEDRFTFSSSIVQSLDGNLSDNESAEDKLKRVRFSETDL